MPVSQNHISSNTAMGANLVANGATFRVWAPDAEAVYVNGMFGGTSVFSKDTDRGLLLRKNSDGRWTGFLDGVQDGDRYKFYVVGKGANGFKRDPYARELTTPADFPGTFGFPSCDCVVRDPTRYQWRSEGFRPPAFNDLIIYQFHVGVFSGPDAKRRQCEGTFLDALDKVEHLVRLGVNAIEPLPIDEAGADRSIGYDGRDFFSPEMAFGAPDADLTSHVQKVNALFAAKNKPGVGETDLIGSMAQLKVMIDIFHLYGIAVILDVVYNHAGPFSGDDDCLYFFDLRAPPSASNKNDNDSLYFTDQGVAGGLAFAYWNQDVRQFLIDNGRFFYDEYRVDGLRFDLVNEIDNHGGAGFCQDLTGTYRTHRPPNPLIAEYWRDPRRRAVDAPSQGLGFDAAWDDRLRGELWGVVSAASVGAGGIVGLAGLAAALTFRPDDLPDFWRAVTCIENHDEVQIGRNPRIPFRADPNDRRSWYARSRSRVANAVLLTAPGMPMLFMGQELLEDKQWDAGGSNLVFFDGLDPVNGQRVMQDFYRFMQELVALRKHHPALRGEHCRVPVVRDNDRVLVMHRWLEGVGRDIIVVVSLNERTFNEPNYQLGFPQGGRWLEAFNSDVYDDIGRRTPLGNGGAIFADGPPMDGFQFSAGVIVPANSVLVFARDGGDQ
jgi:1,4-alpha-glucan branching enzyme